VEQILKYNAPKAFRQNFSLADFDAPEAGGFMKGMRLFLAGHRSR
jgi:hypothetical protein